MRYIKLIIILFVLSFLNSCVSVEAYQKMYLNDSEMELGEKKIATLENNSQAYREGASGANGGKSGGGCGCN